MEKFQNRFRIPSARANWHDYNGGIYFVTICTKNREHYFGEICTEPQMQLSQIGQYAYEQFMNVKSHYPYAEIPLFVIMPDHIHAIVTIDGENDTCRDVARNVSTSARNVSTPARNVSTSARNVSTGVNTQMANISPRKNSLAVVIRGVKSSITKFANENNIPFAWQTRFHDRIIRNQDEFDKISDYIEKNVVNWQNDMGNMK
ncbi:MAG: transposase [Paludibacteraceae bacterium]|nr:transposase [Paludibacteraceae bacterium]